MTKRFSQVNPVVVPVTQAPAAVEAAAAAKVAVVAAEAEAAAKSDAPAEKADEAQADVAVIALTAPAPMAMVAEPVAAAEPAAQDATTTSSTTDDGSTDYTPYIVGGVLLAGGILAVALSSGEEEIDTTPPVTPTPTPTNTVTFSSATTASIAENTPAGATGNIVLDVNATAAATGGAVTYALSGTDASFFTINATTGEIRFANSPNFEGRSPTYNVTVTASSAANGTTPAATATQNLTITVTNVNEAPTFASATVTATAVPENIPTTQVVYTAQATDVDAGTTLTYSLGGTDAAAFAINATTGAVTFRASPDFEAKSSYTFTVTASDAATGGLSATQTVTLAVTNVNEAPVFTTTTTTFAIDENVAAGTAIGAANTFVATDPEGGAVTYTITGAQAANFAISSAGVVTITQSPDFETRPQYTFNVVATDAAGNATTRAVTLNINDIAVEGTRIDGGTIPATTAQTYNAANGNVTFLESGAAGNLSTINNFGSGDIIQTDVATNLYSFTSNGTTLIISYNNNGTISRIELPNAVSSNAFIFNEASAEAAVGFDFFRSTAPAPAAATQSLDASGAATTVNAATNAFTFNESATAPNNTVINNFTADDRIVVSGAAGTSAATRYTFTSQDNDLIISFNNNGVVSRITINDVVSPNAFIFDEASAEAAVGFDFFRYG